MVSSEKRLIWHPRGHNKFIVGGSTQITLYEWIPESSEIKQVASQLELNQMKCFAWSPDPVLDDLIAVGFNNGRVDLLRFEASRQARHGAVVSLPTKTARACNALAFSPLSPKYLAVGLDKGPRSDPNLIIWDVQSALSALSLAPTSSDLEYRPFPSLPRSDGGRTGSDERIIQQHLPAEIVSALAWVPSGPDLLLASVSHRTLQLFDLRNPSQSPQKATSKVHGIATDPFESHRVACFTDGIVSIWDIRRFTHPILTFTAKDASADGANGQTTSHFGGRGKSAQAASSFMPLTHVEFSSTRRDTLATLERDASYVRFWDIRQAQFVEIAQENVRSRESSQSGNKTTRTSWVKPWAATGSTGNQSSPQPSVSVVDPSPYHLILADTRRTRSFPRPFTSFALLPSQKEHPTASHIMLVNREGDLDLHAVHDTPVHSPWSARGDLALGIGCSYTIISGITDLSKPLDPWDLLPSRPSHPGSRAYSMERIDYAGDDSSVASRGVHDSPACDVAPATFGRGDEDGFPALRSRGVSAVRRSRSSGRTRRRVESDNPLPFEHTAVGKGRMRGKSRGRRSEDDELAHAPHLTPGTITLALDDTGEDVPRPIRSPAVKALQNVLESDISMIMRRRAVLAYGLLDPQHNSAIAYSITPDEPTVSEVWLWVHHSQRLLSSPTSIVEGYNFAYQGLLGIWEGFKPIRPAPPSSQPTPRMHARNVLYDNGATASPLLRSLNLDVPTRSASRHRSGRGRNHASASNLPEDFLSAIEELNARSRAVSDGIAWKPFVSTSRLAQRRLALQLCGWSLAQDDLTRAIEWWKRQKNHSQAACWLVFTNQNKLAIEVLMNSEDESHHILSGMLAALTASSSRDPDVIQHCDRLITRLEDPYLRALLTHLTIRDWREVLEEDSLPLRERLAIAFQFLDDDKVTPYLRSVADRAVHNGDLHGLFVTGLTSGTGMDLLQAYVDCCGDVQTAALLASLPPALARDARAGRWMTAYRDILDGWKLYHHRCQLDIERGKILKDAVESAEIAPLDWAPKHILIRCNYCNKPLEPPFPTDSPTQPRTTMCPHCAKSLPRCSVCLMTLSLAPENAHGPNAMSAMPSDAIYEALVFCQTCRHGGHASHIIEWFFGEGASSRAHGTCAIAGCDCRCSEEM